MASTARFPDMRNFFYLPFMHSEDLADQERCVTLYKAAGDADDSEMGGGCTPTSSAASAGFPHRNAVLGRVTTPEEQKFLDDGGFAG